MQISELRAMLEVLTDEDFRAVLPLERCNSSYVRMMEDRRLLQARLQAVAGLAIRWRSKDYAGESATYMVRKCSYELDEALGSAAVAPDARQPGEGAAYVMTADWGDGTRQLYPTPDREHSAPAAGEAQPELGEKAPLPPGAPCPKCDDGWDACNGIVCSTCHGTGRTAPEPHPCTREPCPTCDEGTGAAEPPDELPGVDAEGLLWPRLRFDLRKVSSEFADWKRDLLAVAADVIERDQRALLEIRTKLAAAEGERDREQRLRKEWQGRAEAGRIAFLGTLPTCDEGTGSAAPRDAIGTVDDLRSCCAEAIGAPLETAPGLDACVYAVCAHLRTEKQARAAAEGERDREQRLRKEWQGRAEAGRIAFLGALPQELQAAESRAEKAEAVIVGVKELLGCLPHETLSETVVTVIRTLKKATGDRNAWRDAARELRDAETESNELCVRRERTMRLVNARRAVDELLK